MFLELRGYDEPSPVFYAEDPLAPGPTPLFMNVPPTSGPFPAMAGDLVLPQSLFLPTGQMFTRAIQQVLELYRDFQAGRRKAPEDITANVQAQEYWAGQGMAAVNFAAIIAFGQNILNLILGGSQAINAVQVNVRINGMYNANRYNVQQLLTMNAVQIANQIRQIDRDLELAFANGDRQEAAALSQFRLIYQQRFDQVGGGLLRNWLPIAAIGAAAWYFLRRKRK